MGAHAKRVLVLVLALVLTAAPLPAEAAGSWSVVLMNSCTITGGHFGYGKVAHQVRGIEHGSTGTDHMRARSFGQEWNGYRWSNRVSLPWRMSPRIPRDGDSYSFTFVAVRYDIQGWQATRYHRIRTVVQFLRNGSVQRSITRYSKEC